MTMKVNCVREDLSSIKVLPEEMERKYPYFL